MPYSDCVSPKSRWTSWPAACAPTSAAESAASGAALTSVFHGLSGGRTGQPPTIGPLVTTNGALVEHDAPAAGAQAVAALGEAAAQADLRARRGARWPTRRPSIESVCGSRPVTRTVSVACGRTPTGETRTAAAGAGRGEQQREGGGGGERGGAHAAAG